MPVTADSLGIGYSYVGDVTTSVGVLPAAEIWYLIPVEGRPGDGYTIVGNGFGSSASVLSGKVMWQPVVPPDSDPVPLGVVSWLIQPQGGSGGGPSRAIDGVQDNGTNVENGRITVLVPAGALQPGAFVWVETGP